MNQNKYRTKKYPHFIFFSCRRFYIKKSTTIRSLAARPARRWRCPRTLARADHAPRNHRSRSPGSFNHGVPKWKLKSPRNNCDSAPSSSPQLRPWPYASCNHSPQVAGPEEVSYAVYGITVDRARSSSRNHRRPDLHHRGLGPCIVGLA